MDLRSGRGNSEDAQPYDPAAIAELLRTKRKPRSTKSCFPCRHRKVRCDGLSPCSNCVRRDHASLCRTASESGVRKSSPQTQALPRRLERESPASRGEGVEQSSYLTQNDTAVDANHVLAQLEKIEAHISSLKSDLLRNGKAPTRNIHPSLGSPSQPSDGSLAKTTGEWATRIQNDAIPAILSGGHAVEVATGATTFLGDRSDPPLVLGCRHIPARSPLGPDTSGSDQLAPKAYPFSSLWAPETSLSDIARVLPDDSDVIRYWGVYQSCVHPFYPALVAYDDFGSSLFSFLDRRLTEDGEYTLPAGIKPSWLALLLSVLACGVQLSADPIKERDLRSKVFVCSSFQCLRMSNLFISTDMDQIQALALLGHCLRNNMNMNSAWIVMGSTIRLAQSIGLHIEPNIPSTSSSLTITTAESSQRHRLWWVLIWQDNFLSHTYDRPPTNPYLLNVIPDDTPPGVGNSYANSVSRLTKILMDRARDEFVTPNEVNSVESLLSHKRRVQAVLDGAQAFLVDKASCKTLEEHLQRLALHIHVQYLVCRAYRLCLDCEDAAADQVLRDSIASEYLANACQIVQSFLDMHRLLPAVCRTWSFVHNVASSAIPLKTLSSVSPPFLESLVEQFRPLLQRLIGVLEDEAKECEWYDADTNVRQYGPCSRVASALRETYGDI